MRLEEACDALQELRGCQKNRRGRPLTCAAACVPACRTRCRYSSWPTSRTSLVLPQPPPFPPLCIWSASVSVASTRSFALLPSARVRVCCRPPRARFLSWSHILCKPENLHAGLDWIMQQVYARRRAIRAKVTGVAQDVMGKLKKKKQRDAVNDQDAGRPSTSPGRKRNMSIGQLMAAREAIKQNGGTDVLQFDAAGKPKPPKPAVPAAPAGVRFPLSLSRSSAQAHTVSPRTCAIAREHDGLLGGGQLDQVTDWRAAGRQPRAPRACCQCPGSRRQSVRLSRTPHARRRHHPSSLCCAIGRRIVVVVLGTQVTLPHESKHRVSFVVAVFVFSLSIISWPPAPVSCLS